MSKKKKSKKTKNYYEYQFGKKKSKKDKKKSAYKEPKMTTVKGSLSKKEAKAQKKDLLRPVKVSKEFMRRRYGCNHAGKVITVAEFKAMTPTYAAYTPMLEAAVETFGEDNVRICKDCYDVIVRPDCINGGELRKALVMLYAGANNVTSAKRMKRKEIENINKLKETLGDWNKIVDLTDKLEERGAISESGSKPEGFSDEEIANLNKGVNMGTAY